MLAGALGLAVIVGTGATLAGQADTPAARSAGGTGSPSTTASPLERPTNSPSASKTATPTPTATPSASSTAGCPGTGVMAQACAAIGTADSIYVVVNKKRPLSPKSYVPKPLVTPAVKNPGGQVMRKDAASAMAAMITAAAKEGAGTIGISSAYRSYSTQVAVFQNGVAKTSPTEALKWYAKPGHSEHQTGLTADLIPIGNSACARHQCIGEVSQGKWLAKNSWRFGFILRYEKGKTPITGYNYEPWHFRYIGKDLASLYHQRGFHTLEQFFGLPAAATY